MRGPLACGVGLLAVGVSAVVTAASLFAPTDSMSTFPYGYISTLLADGTVLLTVGASAYSHAYLASAEIYDPGTGSFAPVGTMSTPRHLHTAMRLAKERVRAAVQGLVTRDTVLLEKVRCGDQPLNELHIEIDSRCFTLLALFQPMATDLRSIVAAVKINTDLKRARNLAVNIAEAASRYATHPPVKKLIDVPQMGDIVQAMLRDALDSFVRRDTRLAQQVLNEDDRLDALKTQVFRELLNYILNDPSTVEPSLDLILISRRLERIGDHATNVAEDVIFMVSALDVRHHPPTTMPE